MIAVSMFEAKTNLSKYVSAIVNQQEPYVVIVRNGKPVAKLVPYAEEKTARIGIAKGQLPPMPSLEDFNSIDVTDSFAGNGGIE